MDDTATYFDHHFYTVNEKVETFLVRNRLSNHKRWTACITVATDRIKLLFFLLFKGGTNEPNANSLQEIMPAGLYGYKKVKNWMGSKVMEPWKDAICNPYVQGGNKTVLLTS